jgi:hypothetical protein
MLYYKEIASLLLLGFAVSRLVLRCRNTDEGSWDYSRLWDKESRLDLCLAFLAVLFLLYYLGVMLPHPTMKYSETRRRALAELFLGYIKVDLLALLFVGIVLFRTYLIVRCKVTPSLLWDGLAFGGVACFVGYLGLGLWAASKHYSAPVDLIALLYVGRLASLSVAKMHLWGKVAALALLLAVVLQDVSFSALRVFEDKSVMHAKGEIAQVVLARYQNAAGDVPRLFFPFASRYMIKEFAYYLDYRGVPVEGIMDASSGLKSVSMATRFMTKDGPCAPYMNVICHADATPAPGDLVIVLPDDNPSLAEINSYRAQGELLFFYEPGIPQSLYSFIRSLPIAMVPPFDLTMKELREKEVRDGWLYAAVIAWK